MERVRYCVPEPQVLVQAVNLDQPEILQSRGQAKVLQLWKCLLKGHFAPPNAFVTTMERVRYWEPVRQLLEQAENADHPESLQSIAVGAEVGCLVGATAHCFSPLQ